MKRSLLFTAVLGGTLTAAPAMAEDVSTDFHALSGISSPVPVMTETQMASVEGGATVLDVGVQFAGGVEVEPLPGTKIGIDGLSLHRKGVCPDGA